MPEPLEEQLGLDIAPALQAIQQLDDALTQVVQTFSVNLADAVQTALATSLSVGENIDTAPLVTAVDSALQGAVTTPIPVEGDVAPLDQAITGALDEPRPPIPLEGDATLLDTALADALDAPRTVPVEADTSDAIAAIEALATEPPIVMQVEGDTSGLEAGITQAFDATRPPIPVEGDVDPLNVGIAHIFDATRPPIPVDGDVSQLDAAVTHLFEFPRPPITVEGDVTGLESQITEGLSAPQTVPIEGDPAALEAAVADVFDAPRPPLTIEGDTAPAQSAITALEGEQVTVAVEADTADAVSSIDALGQSATDAIGGSGSGGSGGSGLSGLEGAVVGITAATSAAEGGVGGLTSAIGASGSGAASAVAGGTAYVAFLAETIRLAADAEAQQRRFNDVFGASAEAVKNIDVGGLVISLEDLGKQSGTTTADLEASASRIGLLGSTAHATAPQITETTDQVLALGATLSVQNPRLGDAAAVTDKLSRALTTGGRFAAQLGLNLQAADIKTRAQEIAGANNEVTRFDLLMAGAQLATAQFGDTLGTKFKAGAENAQVQLRALKVALEEALVAIGQPLLAPVLDVLKALLPIAVEAGQALGNLARIFLPFIQALAPALLPVVAALKLVSDGLGVIADVVDKLPTAALVGIAAGIAGIGAAALIATFGVQFLANAILAAVVSTGPIGIALVALAALGAAYDLLGGHTTGAADAATGFKAALFGNVTDASSLSAALVQLGDHLEHDLQDKLDTAGRALHQFVAVINQSGDGAHGLAGALTGTNAAFDAYVKRLDVADQAQGKGIITGIALHASLNELRAGFVDSEKDQLNLLVTNKQLTQAELDHIEAVHKADIAQGDYNGTLKDAVELAAKNADAASAGDKTAFALNVTSDAVAQLTRDFLASKIGADEYKVKLQELGATAADATAHAGDLAAAQVAAADKIKLSSGAVEALKISFAAGAIDALQLNEQLFEMGVSAKGSTSAVGDLQKQIDSFVQTAVGALPTVGASVAAFSSGIKTAESGVQSVLKAGASGIDSAKKSVETAQDALDKALSSAGAAGAKSIANAETAAQAAQTRLSSLVSSGAASASSIANAEATVTTAQDKLNTAIANSGGAGSTAVANAKQRLADANQALVDAQNKSTQDVKDAQAKLHQALDPQVFIDDLLKQAAAIADFQKNLTRLVAEGFGALAGALSQKGPEVGGQLAAALASDPAKAKVADGAEQLLGASTTGFQNFETHNAAALGALGTKVAGDVNAGVQAAFDLAHPTQAQLDASARLIAQAEPTLTGVAKAYAAAGVIAFEAEFGRLPTVAEVQSGKTVDALNNAHGPMQTAGQTTGQGGTLGYGQGLDLGTATTNAITNATTIFTAQGHLDLIAAADTLGVTAGRFFDLGIVHGINEVDSLQAILDAAFNIGALMKTGVLFGLQAQSPSKVGIAIGEMFVASIALGLKDSRPVDEAARALTASLPLIAAAVPVVRVQVRADTDPVARSLRELALPAPHVTPLLDPPLPLRLPDPHVTAQVTPGQFSIPAPHLVATVSVPPLVIPQPHVAPILEPAPLEVKAPHVLVPVTASHLDVPDPHVTAFLTAGPLEVPAPHTRPILDPPAPLQVPAPHVTASVTVPPLDIPAPHITANVSVPTPHLTAIVSVPPLDIPKPRITAEVIVEPVKLSTLAITPTIIPPPPIHVTLEPVKSVPTVPSLALPTATLAGRTPAPADEATLARAFATALQRTRVAAPVTPATKERPTTVQIGPFTNVEIDPRHLAAELGWQLG